MRCFFLSTSLHPTYVSFFVCCNTKNAVHGGLPMFNFGCLFSIFSHALFRTSGLDRSHPVCKSSASRVGKL